MTVPSFTRIQKEDLPGAPDWMGNFLDSYNHYGEQTFTLWNRGIGFDNLKGTLATAAFATPSNYSDGANENFTAFTFPITITGATVVILGGVQAASGNYTMGVKPLSIPQGAWRESSPGKITISYMTGLNSGTTYNASFLVF